MKQLIILILAAFGIFLGAVFSARGLTELMPPGPVWLGQVLMKAALVLFSLLGIRFVLNKRLQAAGFQRPVLRMGVLKVMAPGLAIGGLSTLLIMFTPAEGIPLIKKLNVLEFLLVVAIWSSLAEEVFIRGFLQTSLEALLPRSINPIAIGWLGIRLSIPVVACAAAFSLMHLSLLFAGIDLYTVGGTLFTTFLLGLVAGAYREKFKSIVPAVIVHLGFNLGAILTGIVVAVLYKILTGELPPH